MKKITFIILTFFALNFNYSQENIGIFGGLNYSFFTDGFASKIYSEGSFGLELGAFYELTIKDKIYFRPKLYFSQQGDKIDTRELHSSYELNQIEYKLTYLSTSLDFKFWDKIYLIAGPQFGILIDQKLENINLGKINSNIDFGINLGTGLKINNLFFEFGIYQGLLTMLEYENNSGNRIKTNNGYVKFTVGYNL